jgi:hypothetical protein
VLSRKRLVLFGMPLPTELQRSAGLVGTSQVSPRQRVPGGDLGGLYEHFFRFVLEVSQDIFQGCRHDPATETDFSFVSKQRCSPERFNNNPFEGVDVFMKRAGNPSPPSNLIKAMVLVFAVTLGSQILMARPPSQSLIWRQTRKSSNVSACQAARRPEPMSKLSVGF